MILYAICVSITDVRWTLETGLFECNAWKTTILTFSSWFHCELYSCCVILFCQVMDFCKSLIVMIFVLYFDILNTAWRLSVEMLNSVKEAFQWIWFSRSSSTNNGLLLSRRKAPCVFVRPSSLLNCHMLVWAPPVFLLNIWVVSGQMTGPALLFMF